MDKQRGDNSFTLNESGYDKRKRINLMDSPYVDVLPTTVQDEEGEEFAVTYEAPNKPDRGTWAGKLEFILACIGYAVGLGNVWRFPYLCYKNGGGAFLIPYVTMLLVIGLPLFFLEFAFGQFASLGPISVWNISPLFKGVGYAMVMVAAILAIYYQIVIAQSLYFLFASFTSKLPWSDCSNSWNTPDCFDSQNNITYNLSKLSTPAEEYYYKRVIGITDGIEHFGTMSWELTLCLLAAWIICAVVLIKGVQSLGKVAYFTAVFPYVVLTILLIRGLLLPGSLKGVLFYITPNFSRLLDARVWVDAATQIFFSLGCCNGGLITMSSFNAFKNNCCRDAIIVACINCATSVYAGLVIFTNLGFMAYTKNTTVEKVAKSGPGLAFVVYPEALNKMPLPALWSVFFFFMMCTVGFGSQFSIIETVLSGVQDELRQFGAVFSFWRQIIFRCSVCFVNFLLGIPLLCGGGYYLFYLIDYYMAGYPLLFIALAEVTVICYVYGLKQFRRDIELMIHERPNWYWRACWMVVTPVLICALIIFYFVASDEFTVDSYRYPRWALALGNLIASSPVACIPLWFLYKYCREGGSILLREFFKPAHEWGPAQIDHRAEFINRIREKRAQRPSRLNDGIPGASFVTSAAGPDGSALGLGGSIISGLAGTGIVDDTGFFQSKLSVAEKLTQAHTKEVFKRVSTSEFASTDAIGSRVNSQSALAAAAANTVALYALGQAQLAAIEKQAVQALSATSRRDDDAAGTVLFTSQDSDLVQLPDRFVLASDSSLSVSQPNDSNVAAPAVAAVGGIDPSTTIPETTLHPISGDQPDTANVGANSKQLNTEMP